MPLTPDLQAPSLSVPLTPSPQLPHPPAVLMSFTLDPQDPVPASAPPS